MEVIKYYCDCCKREISKKVCHIEYDSPNNCGYFSRELCEDCMNLIHNKINGDINETPCDAFDSSE